MVGQLSHEPLNTFYDASCTRILIPDRWFSYFTFVLNFVYYFHMRETKKIKWLVQFVDSEEKCFIFKRTLSDDWWVFFCFINPWMETWQPMKCVVKRRFEFGCESVDFKSVVIHCSQFLIAYALSLVWAMESVIRCFMKMKTPKHCWAIMKQSKSSPTMSITMIQLLNFRST